MRNFNEGDIVVKFKPDYYGNPFHYEQFCQVAVVSDANDEYFSTNGRPVTSLENGTNYTDALQESGYLVHNVSGIKEKWYNWTTESTTIKTIISDAQREYLDEIRKKNDDEISKLRNEITNIEKKIQRLDNMEVTPFGFGELNINDQISKVEKSIENKIKNVKK